MEQKQEDKIKKIAEVGTVFTPSKPVTIRELFAGRYKELEKANSAVIEQGLSLIIYGDRGVGKTSLANVIYAIHNQINIICTKVSCDDPSEKFDDLWKRSFNQINIEQKESNKEIGYIKKENNVRNITLTNALQWNNLNTEIKVSDITEIARKLNQPCLFIFDEFDKLEDKETVERFTYLIKSLSDNCNSATIAIFGIAENVTDLIKNHESVERCLRQIHIPRMSKEELSEIIDKGLKVLGIEIEARVKEEIIDFSEGFPQFVHLLAKYATISAINKDKLKVDQIDFDEAVREAIEDTQETIREAYQKAVMTTRGGIFKEVVMACALTKVDEYGTFRATDIKDILSKLCKEEKSLKAYTYHLGKLCEEEKGELLKKIGYQKQFRYKFKNPIMKAFVKLKVHDLGIHFAQ